MKTIKEYVDEKSNEFTERYSDESIRKAVNDLQFIVDDLNKIANDPANANDKSLQDELWSLANRLCDFMSQAQSCYSINQRGKSWAYSSEAIHTIRFASMIKKLYELKS